MGGSVDEARKRHRRTDGLVIMNDKMSQTEFYDFLRKFYEVAFELLKPGGSFYIWHADNESLTFRAALEDSGAELRQTLIWNKNVFTLGRQDYQWKHEPCLYGWKAGRPHYFVSARNEETVLSDSAEINPKRMKKEELIRLAEELLADRTDTTVINEDRPSRSEEHPTMKPIKLMARLIRNSSKPGWTVLDPFGGSGSTLIACEQLQRRCVMSELDPRYCDVIVDRWETFTGGKAKRI